MKIARETCIPSPRNPVGKPRSHHRPQPGAEFFGRSHSVSLQAPRTTEEALNFFGLQKREESDVFKALVSSKFKAFARQFHPDKNKGARAKENFQAVVAARDLLLADDLLTASGRSNSSADEGTRLCPRCKHPVHPPVSSAMRVFRCPHCDAILRNPSPIKATSSSSSSSSSSSQQQRQQVHRHLRPHTPKTFLREWDESQRTRIVQTSKGFFSRFVVSSDLEGEVEVLPDQVIVVWRCRLCNEDSSVCARVALKSRCICGHKLKEHHAIDGFSCSGNRGHCKCKRFKYHVSMNGWSCRCRCKHKHTDHDPRSSKFPCLREGCKCSAFLSSWICNCGHPWSEHETAFHVSRGRRDRLKFGREWVCPGVRPELTKEAEMRRRRWILRGAAPPTASSAAHLAVHASIPVGNKSLKYPDTDPGRVPRLCGRGSSSNRRSGGSALEKRRAYSNSLKKAKAESPVEIPKAKAGKGWEWKGGESKGCS